MTKESAPRLQHSLRKGIWAAVPTPCNSDGRIDLSGVESNAHYFAETLSLKGVFCNGLMGEGWSMTLSERKAVLEATIAGAGAALRVGVVTTHHSFTDTVALSQHAALAGADHIVLFRPAGHFSPEELYDYVLAVATLVDIPIILFDSAAQSGGYPMPIVRRLGEEGLISGVKCTRDADSVVRLRADCGDAVTVLDPYESHWFSNLIRFDFRALYADPEPYLFQTADCQLIRDYLAAYEEGSIEEAVRICRRLEPLRRTYERWIAGPLERGGPMNAALKHWCARLGMAAGPVRAPLRPLTSEQIKSLDRELDEAFNAVL